MTDTAAALLTPAMCGLAEIQYGMITHAQAAVAGVKDLPAVLVRCGLAETVTDECSVSRLAPTTRTPRSTPPG